ncbi:hypothetical protein ACWEO2_25070 [Nocardia sp. NPDC004278]
MSTESPIRRSDDALRVLDVVAAITEGALVPAANLHPLFTESAIAASYLLEGQQVIPYAVRYLADCVRAMGIIACSELAEPLRGAVPARLAHSWLTAACSSTPDLGRDVLFARWLDMIAALLDVRASIRRRPDHAG